MICRGQGCLAVASGGYIDERGEEGSCGVPSQPMSRAVNRSPNKLQRSNSIINLLVVLIWLLTHPTLVSKLFLFLSLPVCCRSRLLTRGGRGGQGPNYKTTRINPILSCEMREAKYLKCAEVI